MTSSQYDIYCSPKSPRAVVDFGLLQVDEDKLLERLDVLRTPAMFLDSASETSLPPLNTLSICSSSTSRNDDSSSVSSISLEGDHLVEEQASSPRCIFSSYWNKVGGKPISTTIIRNSLDERTTATDASMSDQSYEHLLEKNESVACRRHSDSSQGRRRLWDNRYVSQSEPALAQCVDLSLRKTQSCSAVTGPKQSCLRKGRFSSANGKQRRSSDSSVSFSAQVQVQYLKPVTENWAPRGWSKYFA